MSAATESPHRTEIDLPAGRIRYRDEGQGKPVVFVHGYLVDSRLWDGVVDNLGDRCRCLAPDWPIGAQQMAMKPDADLSPYGIAATIAAFLEALDLDLHVDGLEELALAVEVVVEGPPGDARGADDLLGADRRVAALGEERSRGLDQGRPRRL